MTGEDGAKRLAELDVCHAEGGRWRWYGGGGGGTAAACCAAKLYQHGAVMFCRLQ